MLFIFEIIVTSVGKKGYFCTFYFFTDIIATLTLFLDLGWLYNAMVGTSDFSGKQAVDYYNYAMKNQNLGKGTTDGAAIRIV